MFSVSPYLKKSYIRKDGKSAIYLQIIIARETLFVPLKLFWYPEFWNGTAPIERHKKDSQAEDLRLMLQDEEAKANEIFIRYRLTRKGITKALFEKEWNRGTPSNDFLVFMAKHMLRRLQEKEIELATYLAHQITLTHLKAWKKSLHFDTLDERTAYQFESYLIKKTGCKSINGRWGHHKNFKTYLNEAKRAQIQFMNPYDFFSAKSEEGRHQPLEKAHVVAMFQLYQKDVLAEAYQKTLRAFLVVCMTGFRHGDIRRFSMDWISGDFITTVPEKTRRYGTSVRIPTQAHVLNLIGDEYNETNGRKMFQSPTEQKQNTYIQKIADQLDIPTNVCFQVGRETFATLYMEGDGKLEVLAAFMGHTSTKMSEKYVKIRDERKKEEAHRIAGFLEVKKTTFNN